MTHAGRSHVTALDTVDAAFRELINGPTPLALDGAVLGNGFPKRQIKLDELKSLLLSRSMGYAGRDAALGELAHRAQSGDQNWMIGLLGVLLPGLRRAAGRVARDYPGGESEDVDADVLAGVLEVLPTFDLSAGHIAARLCWAGYRRGRSMRRKEVASDRHSDLTNCTASAPTCSSDHRHPDMVLYEAMGACVITAFEADLIGATRLDGTPLPAMAAVLGFQAGTLRQRRVRAEKKLVAWLERRGFRLSHFDQKSGLVLCGKTEGRRRKPGRPSVARVANRFSKGGDARHRPSSSSAPAPSSVDFTERYAS